MNDRKTTLLKNCVDLLQKEEDRKVTLLKACYELLKKQDNSNYVLNILEETIYYDEGECDGYFLMEDIKIELGLNDN